MQGHWLPLDMAAMLQSLGCLLPCTLADPRRQRRGRAVASCHHRAHLQLHWQHLDMVTRLQAVGGPDDCAVDVAQHIA